MTQTLAAKIATYHKGGTDDLPPGVRQIGTGSQRTAYLHTPDGLGTSRLAASLLSKGSSPLADGTARNWATVAALLGMIDQP